MDALPKFGTESHTLAATDAGAGLKPAHYAEILATRPEIGFFEIHAENYMAAGGPAHRWLAAIGETYPLSVHGVGLSLGSSEPLDRDRLARLARVVSLYRPALVSEHLAWSDFSGRAFPDLLPLPYDDASLRRTAEKIETTQEALRRAILIENPATYLRFAGDGLAETQFLAELCARSGCGLLLDVNNVHVSAVNHGFSAAEYLDAFPYAHVAEIHLAGFAEARDAGGAFLIDNHGGAVSDEVWALYRKVIRRAGPRPTLVEWDNDVPQWGVLHEETLKASAILGERIPSPLAGEGGSPEARRMRGFSVEQPLIRPSATFSRHRTFDRTPVFRRAMGRRGSATGAPHDQNPHVPGHGLGRRQILAGRGLLPRLRASRVAGQTVQAAEHVEQCRGDRGRRRDRPRPGAAGAGLRDRPEPRHEPCAAQAAKRHRLANRRAGKNLRRRQG
jgi:uncharacterized protein (UPF0276 family)